MQMIDEVSIPTTEIEADGFITRAETLERINANKAKPIQECVYPKCEECDKYHGQYCTVPIVVSKQMWININGCLEMHQMQIESLQYEMTRLAAFVEHMACETTDEKVEP